MATTTQKIESLSRLVAAGHEYHAHQLAERWDDVLSAPRKWELCEEGHWYATEEAESLEEALEIARDNVDRSNYGEAEGTMWIEVRVRCAITGEEDSATVTCDPEEPECTDGGGSGLVHDWQSPVEIVGGIKENPGVWGRGGGVIIHEVCLRCGCKRTTDTWAQDMSTGVQGLRSVSYEPGAYADSILPAEVQAEMARIDVGCDAAREAAAYALLAARGDMVDVRDCVLSSLTRRQQDRLQEVCEALNSAERRGGKRASGLLLYWIQRSDDSDESRIAAVVRSAL